MASVKVKFRPSMIEGKEGIIYYQIIHNRVVRQMRTDYRIYREEWDQENELIIISNWNILRKRYLVRINNLVNGELKKLKKIVRVLDKKKEPYTSDEVIETYFTTFHVNRLFSFMEDTILHMNTLGKERTSEAYLSTLNSFKRFREGVDIALDEIDSEIIADYEVYLKENKISINTSSFYMRNLRAIYNRAIEKGLTAQQNPFKRVYTGVNKTTKRAISLRDLKEIRILDLSMDPKLDFARDMFLFSFYTRGMSFVDMAYLKKRDLRGAVLSYRRRKTGQLLFVRWEKVMQDIVKKYDTGKSYFLLPIIQPLISEERVQYLNMSHTINRRLKVIGKLAGLRIPLTMYVARHAWASIAKSKNIPLSVISECMGHDSEKTTQIYLTSLDSKSIDRANRLILKSVCFP